MILERDGWVCKIRGPRCAGTADSVDHIVSLADGGAFLDPINLRASCLTCNAGRRDGTRYTGSSRSLSTAVESRTVW